MRHLELNNDDLLKMLYYLKLVRGFEERLSLLTRQGKLVGGVFSGIGQEAIGVGACYSLRKSDYIFPAHRDVGAFLVKGGDIKALLAQVYGKVGGMSMGRDPYLHTGVPKIGIFGSTSMLGTQLPVACGMALAFKMRREDNVCVTFFGEGATSMGDTHEAMNFAGIHKLPVIFICENNFYAYSTPLEKTTALEDLADRGAAYGFPGWVCSGNDLLAVYRTVQKAIERARKGDGPSLIECKTYRWHGHSEHDKPFYRSEEEFLEWKSRDPIPRFELYLKEKSILTQEVMDEVAGRIAQEIEGAVEYAENSPFPEGPTALQDVLA